MQSIWDLVSQWSSTEVRLSEACRAHLQQKTQHLEEAKKVAATARTQLGEARKLHAESENARGHAEKRLSKHLKLYKSRLEAVAEAVSMVRGSETEAIAQAIAMARDCGDPAVFTGECAALQNGVESAKEHANVLRETVAAEEGKLRVAMENVAVIESQMGEIKNIQRQIEKKVD